ncbi:hypothetical protein AMJ39_01525 [candidate division TA06 bacterium DG_24]|uniref:RNA polymerase sigma factor n=1 Tax=candidate division TA06 bacterium DG_24 TaxID=1703770 RepID=A0A0S7WVA3_UNCT6|nr:MAG: hypothetical protein AMJ39_01525 [candidate division TA06 bacterium DG_24]
MSAEERADAAALDDHELVRNCQRGDRAAFDELMLRHQARIFNAACRLLGDIDEAEEVAQDTFVRAYRGIGGFRFQSSFFTWLYRILLNLAANRRKARARQRRIRVDSLDRMAEGDDGWAPREPADRTCDPEQELERRELAQQIEQCLAELSHDHAAVVVMRDVQGMSYEEIAGVLECSVGTVKSRLHRARAELRKLMSRYGEW